MEQNNQFNLLLSFLPLLLISLLFALLGHFLAKEKGRNVKLWTILGAIPFVNMFLMWFFVGAANLRLEKKIDQLLSAVDKSDI
jgi:hypothetical protein